jgi:hypothetical protein
MTEYEYVFETFDQNGSIEIPDEAVGVTVGTFGDHATVRYLKPVVGDE